MSYAMTDPMAVVREMLRVVKPGGYAIAYQADFVTQLELEGTTLRRIYRLSAEATGPLAVSRGVLDEAEARDMVAGLIALEKDPHAVVVTFPDMRVIAQH
jgi:ubiquinone/menaquinone biosynthesis C-methylase UbiE